MNEQTKAFIELLRDNEDDFYTSLQRRKSTSSLNKEKHKKVMEVLNQTWYTDQELIDVLNQDDYYKHKQLDGVIWVMRIDNDVKVDIIAAYNTWLE